MVDFAVHGGPLVDLGVKVAAASVDSIDNVAALKEGLRVSYPMYGEVDIRQIAADTGAHIQTGDREFLHATGFIIKPDGTLASAVYATGPVGRLWSSEVLRVVRFLKNR